MCRQVKCTKCGRPTWAGCGAHVEQVLGHVPPAEHLLDVRTPAEFAAGHIPGAINVPVDELEGRLNELGAQEQSIVVYCRSGSRSARAARMLEGAGYTQVHDLGPMSAW